MFSWLNNKIDVREVRRNLATAEGYSPDDRHEYAAQIYRNRLLYLYYDGGGTPDTPLDHGDVDELLFQSLQDAADKRREAYQAGVRTRHDASWNVFALFETWSMVKIGCHRKTTSPKILSEIEVMIDQFIDANLSGDEKKEMSQEFVPTAPKIDD